MACLYDDHLSSVSCNIKMGGRGSYKNLGLMSNGYYGRQVIVDSFEIASNDKKQCLKDLFMFSKWCIMFVTVRRNDGPTDVLRIQVQRDEIEKRDDNVMVMRPSNQILQLQGNDDKQDHCQGRNQGGAKGGWSPG